MKGVGISDNAADSLDLGPSPEEEHAAYNNKLREVARAMNSMTGADTPEFDGGPRGVASFWHSGGGIYLVAVELGADWQMVAGAADGTWGWAIDKDGEGFNIIPNDVVGTLDDAYDVARHYIELVLWWSTGANLQRLPSWVRSIEPF